MIRAPLPTIAISSLLVVLASCGKNEHSAVDVRLLSTDIHVSVAQRALVFPFIALDGYAYRKQSFPLNRKGDKERAVSALKQFLRDTADPKKPLVLDGLSVVVRTFGWNDADMSQRQVCSLLTREWARSVCDNPWAATQQALPANRFRLVDLHSLQIEHASSPANCSDDGKSRRPLPERTGEAVMLCTAKVYGGDDDEFHSAVIRIDGHFRRSVDGLAAWTKWRDGRSHDRERGEGDRRFCAICDWAE